MGDAIAGANLFIYILFGVFFLIGSLIMLYFNSVIKQKDTEIANIKKDVKELKETIKRDQDGMQARSEKDDDKVTAVVTKEMDRRIVNIEQLHAKVEANMEKVSVSCERVAYLEGLHAEHKKT